jgi:sporulation protein YlmC with PRC-barrel domain
MLITHVNPRELWGKKVYDTGGQFLGEVVAIGSRRGVVHKVVVQRTRQARPEAFMPPADTQVDANVVVLPAQTLAGLPRLRVVH